jgi:hypothetical protein
MTVGSHYRQGVTRWAHFVEYLFTDQGHELRMFLPQPTQAMISAVNDGDWMFSFYQQGPALFFLYMSAFMDWSDAPFSVHLVPERHRVLPSLLAIGAIIDLHLVDAETGILVAASRRTLNSHFVRLWHGAINRQAELAFDRRLYDLEIVKAHSKLSPRQMQRAAMATTRGQRLILPATAL